MDISSNKAVAGSGAKTTESASSKYVIRSGIIKKTILIFVLAIMSIFYVVYVHDNNSFAARNDAQISTPSLSSSTSLSPPITNTSISPGPSTTGTNSTPSVNVVQTQNTTTSQGQYKNGIYTGDLADAYYGNVQVQVQIQNGMIYDMQFLSYPSDYQQSLMRSQYALPILRQEAISAQNANVDIVSGATLTSQAFAESLASALSKAKV